MKSCPTCGAEPDLKIDDPLDSQPHIVMKGRWVALDKLRATLRCYTCCWSMPGDLSKLEIEIKAGKIAYGEFRPDRNLFA